jgi:hypothetical protein
MYSKCGNTDMLPNYKNKQQRPQTMHAAMQFRIREISYFVLFSEYLQ